MRIPRFWVAVEGSGTGPRGERWFRRAWGWSMSSVAEARAVAQEQLRTALATIRSGTKVGGYYPRVPLREPILDEQIVDGEQAIVVTRNRYGAEVLNTDRVLIADIDLPDLQEPPGLLRRMFRRTAEDPSAGTEPPSVVQRLGVLSDWAAAHPRLGIVKPRPPVTQSVVGSRPLARHRRQWRPRSSRGTTTGRRSTRRSRSPDQSPMPASQASRSTTRRRYSSTWTRS